MTSTPKERPALTPMDSSAIDASHYDPATRRLTIRFKSTGKVFEYDDVDAAKAEAFMGSASPGRFYNEKIKHHVGREVHE